MQLEDDGRTLGLYSGDLIAYADAVGYVVVWNGIRTFTVWQDGKRWDSFECDVGFDGAVAQDVALGWIMCNTFE